MRSLSSAPAVATVACDLGSPLDGSLNRSAVRARREDGLEAKVAYIPAAVAALCEIDNCGVLATGRCASCRQAFCASHAGTVAACAPCVLAEARRRETQRARKDAWERFLGDPTVFRALVEEMRAANCGGLEAREAEQWIEQRSGRRGRRQTQVKRIVPLKPAWPVGEVHWTYIGVDDFPNMDSREVCGVTAAAAVVKLTSDEDLLRRDRLRFPLAVVVRRLIDVARAQGLELERLSELASQRGLRLDQLPSVTSDGDVLA